MNRSLLHARIPNLFAFFLLVSGILLVSFLTTRGIIFEGRADAGSQPKNIRITNITDTSATIGFTTDEPSIASVTYGTDASLGTIALDDRDKQINTPTEHTVHYITVTNLHADTAYFFAVLSNDTEYRDGDQPFSFTSSKQLTNNSENALQALRGKIIRSDGASPAESIVYLTSPDMQTLSSLALPDGRYTIPLDQARTKDLANIASLKPDTVLQLLAVTNTEQASATLLAGQETDVPTITLSKSYDFTTQSEPTDIATESAGVNFPSFTGEEDTPADAITITSPQANDELSDAQPLFRGTALPNETVEIIIESDPITTTITADANGRWQFRPDADLSPGEHHITIKTKNASGILTEIRQSFTVFAQGSQFTEPSGIPTLTQTLTPSVLPTFTPTPTTALPTETPLPSITETQTPTPTGVQTTTRTVTQPPVPKNLGSESLVLAGIVSISLSFIGMLMFVLTRRGGTY